MEEKSLREKLEYLFTLSSPEDLGLVVKCSGKRLRAAAEKNDGSDLTPRTVNSIDWQYRAYQKREAEDRKVPRPKIEEVSAREMLTYLQKFYTDDQIRTEVRTVKERLFGEIMSLSANASIRLKGMYRSCKAMEEAPKKPAIKNYDDEDLSDLKAGTSRHGVNRSSASYATSNNGWSE